MLLDRILIVHTGHLHRVLHAYLVHYNGHRPHWTLGQRPPNHHMSIPSAAEGPVRRHRFLDGLINEYHRAA